MWKCAPDKSGSKSLLGKSLVDVISTEQLKRPGFGLGRQQQRFRAGIGLQAAPGNTFFASRLEAGWRKKRGPGSLRVVTHCDMRLEAIAGYWVCGHSLV